MTYKTREPKWPWHDFLTPSERDEVRKLEKDSHEAKRRLADITAVINPIRNRAIQRAKHDVSKAGQG
jgi:hypothetical protein